MIDVYLGLGSNIGDREAYIQKALDAFHHHDFIEFVSVSSIQETDAVAQFQQPKFLNAACWVRTLLTPRELLEETKRIESENGRTSKGTYDPRTLDIDILFYGDILVSEDDLVIPHPLIDERLFVLDPLCELNSSFKHPLLGLTLLELREQLAS